MKKWITIFIILVILALLASGFYLFLSKREPIEPKSIIESLKAEEIQQIRADFDRLYKPFPESLAYEKLKSDVERLYDPNNIPQDIKQKLAELKEKKLFAELKFYYGSEDKAKEELEKMKQSGEYDKIN